MWRVTNKDVYVEKYAFNFYLLQSMLLFAPEEQTQSKAKAKLIPAQGGKKKAKRHFKKSPQSLEKVTGGPSRPGHKRLPVRHQLSGPALRLHISRAASREAGRAGIRRCRGRGSEPDGTARVLSTMYEFSLWASYLISLSLSFLIYIVGMITVPLVIGESDVL